MENDQKDCYHRSGVFQKDYNTFTLTCKSCKRLVTMTIKKGSHYRYVLDRDEWSGKSPRIPTIQDKTVTAHCPE